jgi:alkanesulfonate monooxygenase SsuD/methylene tetrahydromethanopterin reductase-like flavin-dependent oxidoreductase (luciferase family)
VRHPAGINVLSMKRGMFVAPFDELSDPRLVAQLARETEDAGWDGFFVWDHIRYSPPAEEVSDPWVVLAAVACATERVRLGPLVTPLARRRIHKLARETVTLDRLSEGRLVLGVGLGGDRHGEFEPFGDPADPKERGRLLDEGLETLAGYWDGGLLPRPVQTPRIPVWVAARYPNRRPVRRAARWDGLFPIDLPGPEALAELVAEVPAGRDGFEVVASVPVGADPAPWEEAGATWALTELGPSPTADAVRAALG